MILLRFIAKQSALSRIRSVALRLFGVALFGITACEPLLAAQEINWEVVNRFPLFTEAGALESLTESQRRYRQAPASRNPAVRVPLTLWDPFKQSYSPALLEAPIVVELSLKPAPGLLASCKWTVEDAALPGTSCVGVKHVLPFGTTTAKAAVEVERADGVSHTIATLEMRSILIVSLGDSFASGEGVPDVDMLARNYPGPVARSTNPPRPAYWWDQRCHRSLNSGPAQAAMRLAQGNPKLQVVFLSFACSGAEINEGVLAPFSGRETYAQMMDQHSSSTLSSAGLQINDKRYAGRLPSQLNALLHSLCQDSGALPALKLEIQDCKKLRRPIDALLLSIGGNDIGFGPLIKYAVLNANAFDLAGFKEQRALENERLPERFTALGKALGSLERSASTKINVFITQYHDPTSLGSRHCGVRDQITTLQQRSFSSWFADVLFFGVSDNEIWNFRVLVIEPLAKAVSSAAVEHHWKLVDQHVKDFQEHGYCRRWSDTGPLPWTHNHNDALMRQGPLARAYDEEGGYSSGAMHPNILGHDAYARALVDALEAGLLRASSSPTTSTK